MAIAVSSTNQSPILVTKKNAKQGQIDIIIENIIRENPERDIDSIRALVKEQLVANKKELRLNDKQINKTIAQTNIVNIRERILKEVTPQSTLHATVTPTAENLRANYTSRPVIKPNANVAADYYERYNSMSKAERRLKTKQAKADAEAAFYSLEFSETQRTQQRAPEPVTENSVPKETKLERKLRKQNIDINDVMPSQEMLAEEERQIIQSVEEHAPRMEQENYESSAKRKVRKKAAERTSAAEHAAQRTQQRISQSKPVRDARYLTSQGLMNTNARLEYNNAQAISQRAAELYTTPHYQESGVNWRELYADTLGDKTFISADKTFISSSHQRRNNTNPRLNHSTVSETVSGAGSETISNVTTSTSNAVRNEAEEATRRAAREAEEAARKNKKLKWIAGIGAVVAFITGYFVGAEVNKNKTKKVC